jgi:hypothetical protein
VGWNHKRVFELSASEYFKWCAADDLMASDYLSACLGRLEAHSDAVLCYSNAIIIDDYGVPIEGEGRGAHSSELPLDSPDLVTRFSSLLSPIRSTVIPYYAVIRSSALRRIRPHGNYLAADRCLLAELSLLGRFLRVPDTLFYRRRHAKNTKKGNTEEMILYAPSRPPRYIVREWRVAFEHLMSVRRAPANSRLKLKLLRAILRWIVGTRVAFCDEAKELVMDVVRQSIYYSQK